MWPISCPETSVRNYHSRLRKIPDDCRSHLDGGGSLTSRKFLLFSIIFNLHAFRLLLEITSQLVNETLDQNPACTNPTKRSVWNNFLLWNYTQRPSVGVIFALSEWVMCFRNYRNRLFEWVLRCETMHRDLPSAPNLWSERGGPLVKVQYHTNSQLHVIYQ